MSNQTVENNIIDVIKKFDPTKSINLSDIRLIVTTQQVAESEIFEAGINGSLFKIVNLQTSDGLHAKEDSIHLTWGYLFITNKQLRFFSFRSGGFLGNQREIDTNYCWQFYEISYSGLETSTSLFLGKEKSLRFRTPLGELKFENSIKETRLEDFGNILKDKTTRKSTIPKQNSNLIDELERLAKLKSQGILSNEEFELAKSKLLKQ